MAGLRERRSSSRDRTPLRGFEEDPFPTGEEDDDWESSEGASPDRFIARTRNGRVQVNLTDKPLSGISRPLPSASNGISSTPIGEPGARGTTFVPAGLNWLNVPEAVKEAVVSLDRALVESRRDNKRLEEVIRRMETRMANLERVNDKLVRAVRAEQEKSHQLNAAVRELESKAANEDQIVSRAVEELRKAFHPEELRATLRKVEIASKQPQALARRIEALEHARHSSLVRASNAEQARKAQRGRVDDAVNALRKLAA